MTGNSKDEKKSNRPIYKVVRWAGERSVVYTKGTRKKNYRPWWNKEIKQKRKANRKRRQLERRKEMGKEQNMREIIKRNEYQKKKVKAQREINKAMMEEEDRKIEGMRRKKSNREYWDYLKGPEDREQKKEHETMHRE